MAGYMYRRSSGIYAVRICVPVRLRLFFGRREIHVSTKTTDLATAKAAAFAILATWQQRLVEIKTVDLIKIAEGSALLSGGGLVTLLEMESAFGISRQLLLNEVRNVGVELVCVADGWQCVRVSDVSKVDRDFDGTFMLDDALERGQPERFSGAVLLSDRLMAISHYQDSEVFNDCMFWLDRSKKSALFCEMHPGRDVPYAKVLIEKSAMERVRTRLASGISPDALARAKEALASLHKHSAVMSPATTTSGVRFSALLESFLAEKKHDWKPDRYVRMEKMCGRFGELMSDPFVHDIDRVMVRKYRELLRQLPLGVRAAQKLHSSTSLIELIHLTKEHDEPLQADRTVADYLEKLSEMFNWAVLEDYLSKNPAQAIATSTKPKKSAQNDRKQFLAEELTRIFGANWFATGAGEPNSFGRYREYRPHYFWAPLLGLFSGGRLNELSQLYVSDIKGDGLVGWFIDFNLDADDKIAVDEASEPSLGDDKSLKNINSDRCVPLHSKLVELGFIQYVEALKGAGYKRLFPELKRDATKGYGKPVGNWFNERYLGNQLGIVRDGKKTFHSFRHTFATALTKADVIEHKVGQLMGHVRGKTESGMRYSKDSAARELRPYLELVSFDLPKIAPFNCEVGLLSIAHALAEKERVAKRHVKRTA